MRNPPRLDCYENISSMTSSDWTPLGIETDDEVAEYDALHEGVPDWMEPAYWKWVRDELTVIGSYPDGSGRFPLLDIDFAEAMCQTLQLRLPDLSRGSYADVGAGNLAAALAVLQRHPVALSAADYILAHGSNPSIDSLEEVLMRCKSAYTVGTRMGRPGLVARVPVGVQLAADAVMNRSAKAGVRLAKAWEALYGIEPRPSEAYRLAIQAVEDAAIPIVSPTNAKATLGTVLAQLESQGDWALPMAREHDKAPTTGLVVDMARALWHGQHDRHGGQPSAPGDVSEPEARVAVSLAVSLVGLFSDYLVERRPATP